LINTIPNPHGPMAITYSPEYSALCSVGKAPFHGTIVIQYFAHGALLEFESFENWIRLNANAETTIEGYCRMAFDALAEVLGDIPLAVSVFGETTVHGPVEARIERLYDEKQ